LDGRLARASGKTKADGAALDSVLDRYSEAAMLIGLAWFYRDQWVLLAILAFLAGSFLVPYTRARGEALGIEMKVGLMQRPERVVILGLATAFGPAVERWILTPDAGGPPCYFLTVAAIVLLAVSTQFTSAHRLFHLTAALAPAPAARHANAGGTGILPVAPGVVPVSWAVAMRAGTAAGFVIAATVDFCLVLLLVNNAYRVTGVPVAPWLATGVSCFFCTLGHFLACRSSRTARPGVIAVGAALLNTGGVAVLSMVPGLDYRFAWILARIAVLDGWNYPMHGWGQSEDHLR
jgi:phosphatidylglycerophosphate synthase